MSTPRPIYSLEERTTVKAVLEHLKITVNSRQHSDLGQLIYNHYFKLTGEKPKRKNQRLTPESCVKKASVYPYEYLPVMINIITDYFKNINK